MKWISVNDRLPSKYDESSICLIKGMKQATQLSTSYYFYEHPKALEITHWLDYTLPEEIKNEVSKV